MWIRLHIVPKICKYTEYNDFTIKQKYYYDTSLYRYLKTEDGQYISSLKSLIPEIGRIEDIRYIVNK